jgi:septal ring factor EnvC (AmiA/AmiB activator)
MANRVAKLRAATEHRKAQVERILLVRQEVQMERDTLTMRREELSATKKRLDSQRQKLRNNVASAKKAISQMSDKQKQVLESKMEHEAMLTSAKKELKRLQTLAKNNKTGSSFSSKTRALNLPVVGGRVKRYKGNMAEIVGKEGATVTSIYEGKVLDIKQNKMTNYYEIYIAHGKYITSYANLSEVAITKNATVKKGQRIGTIGSAINLSTMEMEHKIVFGIYSPNPDEVMSAANCFKK